MPVARLALLLSLTLLGACDSGSTSKDAGPAPRIFGAQRDALGQAKAVQDTVKQAAERQRQGLEEQTP
jgi:hypothetical protein